ncbi:Intracellular sulfur oxidation protein DsrF [BD1-7 clade bacterium]|uniref:Intracellular sulfur oxidation protein DsrF n=1 Tax=BD1-7 clade bacterium TaxID=2029982 RepID=A0A5S9NTB2_9GAMM|nr:Intracellular sulfur oxidation protein DsrF [BD1-7 clade bacterium]CAA0109140.1 Intracellular sulfur oxidation protein DsrF [BD1-7 clade bacterium]
MQYLYILRKPPYQGTLTRESLDMALATAAFDQQVQILFLGDGVFALKNEQQTETLQRKNISKTLPALELYDINDVFVCTQSLADRGMTDKPLCISPTLINSAEINDKIRSADKVITL